MYIIDSGFAIYSIFMKKNKQNIDIFSGKIKQFVFNCTTLMIYALLRRAL